MGQGTPSNTHDLFGGVLLLFLLELEVILVEVLVGLLGRLERLLLSSFASRHLDKCCKEFDRILTLKQISDDVPLACIYP